MRCSRIEVVEAVEEGDKARREPEAEVGDTWDSESLKDLFSRRTRMMRAAVSQCPSAWMPFVCLCLS